jgi:hypothetical protein
MIVLEFKLKGKPQQYRIIDKMIRTAQFKGRRGILSLRKTVTRLSIKQRGGSYQKAGNT